MGTELSKVQGRTGTLCVNPASDGTGISSVSSPDLKTEEIPQPGQGSKELPSVEMQSLPKSSLRELLLTEVKLCRNNKLDLNKPCCTDWAAETGGVSQ